LAGKVRPRLDLSASYATLGQALYLTQDMICAMPIRVVEPAEGLPPRRAFTVAEVLRMQEAGIIQDDENFELIEGEIICMQAKTHVHELIKSALTLKLARALPDELWLGVESTMYLSDRTFVEPDLVVYRRGLKLEDVRGSDIILAIEVALTSLKFDRGLKAKLYARHGVRELWVIDAAARRTFVHHDPKEIGWAAIVEKGPDEVLSCSAIPGFAIKLADV
jgi:Uma2 family endonuclease